MSEDTRPGATWVGLVACGCPVIAMIASVHDPKGVLPSDVTTMIDEVGRGPVIVWAPIDGRAAEDLMEMNIRTHHTSGCDRGAIGVVAAEIFLPDRADR